MSQETNGFEKIKKYQINPADFKVDPNNKVENRSGSFGIVSFYIQSKTNKKCAKKEIAIKEKKAQRFFIREVEILGTHEHPAIVPFLGCCLSFNKKKKPVKGNIFLEAMEYGSLDVNINKNNMQSGSFLDDTHKLIISYGVACAIEFLHKNNIVHRDLKPSNILLDSELQPFVTDFGISKDISVQTSVSQSINASTPLIMSPEFYSDPQEWKNNPCIDVYAYAITLYHLITGVQPMLAGSDIVAGKRPNIPPIIPSYWTKLIEDCWQQAPDERPTFTDICNRLESDQFVNDSINKDIFNAYKSKVYSKRLKSVSFSDTNIIHVQESNDKKPKVIPILDQLYAKANEGDLKTQYFLARALRDGTYGPPNIEEAIVFYKKVRKQEKEYHIEATYELGKCQVKKEKYKEASELFSYAVTKGNSDAAYDLAELIIHKKFQPKRPDKLKYLLKFAADANNLQAIKKYAFMLENGCFDECPKATDANIYIKKGSDLGDPELMHLYAQRLELGSIGIPKDVNQAMQLLIKTANSGYSEAQYDYGMHLLNGINVEKDIIEAADQFRLAANNGHAIAMLWYSILLQQKGELMDGDELIDDDYNFFGDPKDAELYFNKCKETKSALKLPEFLAIDGEKKVQSGRIIESFQPLLSAMSKGSYYAAVQLGNICEENPQYGNSKFFYEYASNLCHCLDELGFNTPVEIKQYICPKCDKSYMCEACAKFLHADHNINEHTKTNLFVCCCGKEGTSQKCNLELIGETCCYQHLYQCTCNPNNSQLFICRACAEKYHEGHELIDCGLQKNFCSFGLKKLPKYTECTALSAKVGAIKQRCFQCLTCNMFGNPDIGICEQCAKKCHAGHYLLDLGVRTFKCICNTKKCCYLKK